MCTFLGIDFGTLNTVIAVARNRGVDVVSTISARDLGHSREMYIGLCVYMNTADSLFRSQMRYLTGQLRK